MTGADRIPDVAAGAPGPSPGRRRALRIAAGSLLAAVAAWGLFTWLFYNPFEGRVERLDRLIPSSVAFAVRGSLGEVLDAPLVRERIRTRPEVEDLLRSIGMEDLLRRVADEQERMNARLPGFVGGVDLRRDLLGSETAVFGAMPSGLAVATRVSPKARALLSFMKHGWARRKVEEGGGPRITRFPLFYEVDASGLADDPAWATAWAALVKDVLVVGNDRDLVQEAVRLAGVDGAGSLPDRPDAGTAFSADSSAPVRAWVDLGTWERGRDAAAALEGPAGFAVAILDVDGLATAQAAASFRSAQEVSLDVSGVRADGSSKLAEALAAGAARPAGEGLREAAVLAPVGSAAVVARVEARAGALLRAAFGRFEGPVREEIEKSLAEEKTTFDDVCREVDDVLAPGASVVVERLPECDALPLDKFGANDKGEYVLPVPGVLLVLRQRSSSGEGTAERFFRRWMASWKERLETFEELGDLPPGMTGFRFRPRFLTADKALWRPAAAFEGDLVLLSLNEGTLRRALEARAGKRPALSDFEGFGGSLERCGEGQVAVYVEAKAALKLRADEQREWATRRVQKDWEKERRRVFAEVARDFHANKKVITQKEIEDEVDRRMDDLAVVQRDVEFPRAREDFLRSLQVYDGLRSVAASIAFDGTGFRGTLVVGTGR